MSGIALSTTLPTRSDRKVYIVWMAMVWVAVFGGFGLDLARYVLESSAPPAVLHVHAAVYVAWLLLGSVQIFLVETGNIRLHMRRRALHKV